MLTSSTVGITAAGGALFVAAMYVWPATWSASYDRETRRNVTQRLISTSGLLAVGATYLSFRRAGMIEPSSTMTTGFRSLVRDYVTRDLLAASYSVTATTAWLFLGVIVETAFRQMTDIRRDALSRLSTLAEANWHEKTREQQQATGSSPALPRLVLLPGESPEMGLKRGFGVTWGDIAMSYATSAARHIVDPFLSALRHLLGKDHVGKSTHCSDDERQLQPVVAASPALIAFRNYAFAPFVEELYFRVLPYELLRIPAFSAGASFSSSPSSSFPDGIFLQLSTVVFALAHAHHGIRYFNEHRRSSFSSSRPIAASLKYALMRSAGDMLITGTFGALSAVLFMKMGRQNMISVTLAHGLCNYLGPPSPGAFIRLGRHIAAAAVVRRGGSSSKPAFDPTAALRDLLIVAAYVLGISKFISFF